MNILLYKLGIKILPSKHFVKPWFADISTQFLLVLQKSKRHLNLHEHLNFKILKDYGINVPKFGVAKTKEEAKKVAEDLKTENMVVKAQVLTGGRGKGSFKDGLKGGVQMVFSPTEAENVSEQMLGKFLVTKQSGPAGKPCHAVMVVERKFPRREFYLTIMMERAFKGPVIIASTQGGVNIEDVAKSDPNAIIYEPINYSQGLQKDQAKKVIVALGIRQKFLDIGVDTLMNMYKLLVEKDCIMVEINPFAEDSDGILYALDCKIRFDDNAQFRHKDLWESRDISQVDPKEVEASKFNLNYIALDGTIGCMVNGAGLAMATLDVIALHGGTPANFLDVGGGATKEAVHAAFKIITSDKAVMAILVNIFGGIIRCDLIAEGIISAAKELHLTVPIVCRLQGTNVDEAKVKIGASGMKILPVDRLDEAARLVVKLSKIVELAHDAELNVQFNLPL